MAAALEGEKGQCWKAWREGLQGCGDGHVHLGPVAALGSAGSWRPGAFRGRYAGVCGAGVRSRRPEGPLRSGSRRPISCCGRGTPRRGVGPAPSAEAGAPGAACGCADSQAHRAERKWHEYERGMHGMARGPGQEEWALIARRAAEEAARRSRSGSSRGKIAISPLRSPLPARPRQRPAFIRGSANLAPPRSPRGP